MSNRWANATSKSRKWSAYAANRDSNRRLRRTGSHPLGHLLGKAASIYENGFATMTQNFGPEARGGACSAQLVLSDSPVLYPYVTRPDIMVVMSQEAYNRFAPELKPGGIAHHRRGSGARFQPANGDTKVYSIPATRIAEELGKRMVLNSVMVGFFTAVTKLLTADAVRKAVADSVPPSFRELNLKAFDKGFEYGTNSVGWRSAPSRPGRTGVFERVVAPFM